MHDPPHDDEFAKNLRISPFNEDLSNDATFSQIHLTRELMQYKPSQAKLSVSKKK
jgi:hypothetical protein